MSVNAVVLDPIPPSSSSSSSPPPSSSNKTDSQASSIQPSPVKSDLSPSHFEETQEEQQSSPTSSQHSETGSMTVQRPPILRTTSLEAIGPPAITPPASPASTAAQLEIAGAAREIGASLEATASSQAVIAARLAVLERVLVEAEAEVAGSMGLMDQLGTAAAVQASVARAALAGRLALLEEDLEQAQSAKLAAESAAEEARKEIEELKGQSGDVMENLLSVATAMVGVRRVTSGISSDVLSKTAALKVAHAAAVGNIEQSSEGFEVPPHIRSAMELEGDVTEEEEEERADHGNEALSDLIMLKTQLAAGTRPPGWEEEGHDDSEAPDQGEVLDCVMDNFTHLNDALARLTSSVQRSLQRQTALQGALILQTRENLSLQQDVAGLKEALRLRINGPLDPTDQDLDALDAAQVAEAQRRQAINDDNHGDDDPPPPLDDEVKANDVSQRLDGAIGSSHEHEDREVSPTSDDKTAVSGTQLADEYPDLAWDDAIDRDAVVEDGSDHLVLTKVETPFDQSSEEPQEQGDDSFELSGEESLSSPSHLQESGEDPSSGSNLMRGAMVAGVAMASIVGGLYMNQ